MTKQYILGMLAFGFLLWAVIVDNAVLPKEARLQQETGLFSRYRIKKNFRIRGIDPDRDELIVYLVINNMERLYYMDFSPRSERALKFLKTGDPVEVGYSNSFPKVWKRCLYEVRSRGLTLVSYTARQREERQRDIMVVTGSMGAVFVLAFCLGLIKKPKKRKG